MIYSNNVYNLRTDLHITQNEMANDFGISIKTVQRIESGKQNITLDMAYRIATYFRLLIPEVFPLSEELATAPSRENSR